MGKRSFICRSSLGGQLCFHVHTTFLSPWLFVVLCWCFDLWGYCLSQNIFSEWFMFYGLWGIWNLHFLIIFSINVTLSRFICLFMLIFFLYFCLGLSDDDALLVNTYHIQSVYFSGIQESVICVVDRNQILFDVTSSDLIVHSTSMVNGILMAVLTFFFYISHFTDNKTKMQVILFIDYSWTVVSFSI